MPRINFTPLDSKPLSPAGRGQGEGGAPSSAQETPSAAPSEPSQPADSPLVLERVPGGLTVRVPPAGYGHRSCFFMLLFGLVWDLFTIGVTVSMASQRGFWPAAIFFIVFSAIGVIPVLIGLHMGRRQAAIALIGDRLMIMQIGIFGPKRREWVLDDIEAIEVGRSGWEVNDQPLPELQIRSRDGQSFSMLTARDAAELNWLAAELTRQLDAETSAEEQASS